MENHIFYLGTPGALNRMTMLELSCATSCDSIATPIEVK
jgi:hypothetical protein